MMQNAARRTVLLVDDQPIYRDLLAQVLSGEGYSVLSASNGAEALSVLSSQIPDLVLLDLQMPVMDGLTFLKRLREAPNYARIPVVVLSEVRDREKILVAVELGLSGYILKSQFSLRAVLQKVRSLVSGDDRQGAAGEHAQADPSPSRVGPATPAPTRAATAPVADPAAKLRDLEQLLTREEVLARVGGCEQLKALSPAVAHVLKLTGNPGVPVEAVSKAIAQDHAIALKILRLANSTVYTRGAPADSVQKAVVRIGMERIRQAVMNIAIVERFQAQQSPVIDTLQFWEHSIATGLIAAELTHAYAPKDTDSAFTMGLLHDVGRIVFAEQLGGVYETVLQTARELAVPLEQVETRMLRMNHADVMEDILQSWRFTKDLAGPILHHHLSAAGIQAAAPSQRGETVRLALANRIANAMLLGTSGNNTVYDIEDLCRSIELDPEILTRIVETAREQTADVKCAMLSTGNGGAWESHRDAIRSQLPATFRPLFVSPRPVFDAFRVLFKELGVDAHDEPTSIVVHIPTAKDQAEAGKAVRAAETDAPLSAAPLIILSPAGKLTLEAEILRDRQVIALPTPLVLSRLISAAHELGNAPVAA